MANKPTPLLTRIRILLEGELTEMDSFKVNRWFEDAFTWVDKTERYTLGVKLRDAKQRWEKELLEAKSKSQINYESKKQLPKTD
jgi:hypothetical protein